MKEKDAQIARVQACRRVHGLILRVICPTGVKQSQCRSDQRCFAAVSEMEEFSVF